MAVVLMDPSLHEFTGGFPATYEQLQERYARLVRGSADSSIVWLNWVLRERDGGQLVGTVQATVERVVGGCRGEVAWVLGTPWQHHGLAKEAAAALVAWLVTRGCGSVHAHIHRDHLASGAVARAAGLTPRREGSAGEVLWRRTWGPG